MMVDWEIEEIEEMDEEEAKRFLAQKFNEYKYEVNKVKNFWAILGAMSVVTTFAAWIAFADAGMMIHSLTSFIASFVVGSGLHFFGDYKDKKIAEKATDEYRELEKKVKEKTKKR